MWPVRARATRFRCERCRREPWSGSRASGVLGTRGGHDAVAGEQPTTHLPWRGRARRVVMYGRVEPGPAVLAPPLGERNGIGVKRRSRAWNWSAFRDQRSRLSPLCSPDTPDRHHPRSRCQSRDPRSWGHLPSGQSPAPPTRAHRRRALTCRCHQTHQRLIRLAHARPTRPSAA